MKPHEIRELRERLNLKQDRFAKFVGIESYSNSSVVSNWESGKHVPSRQAHIIMYMMVHIADALEALGRNEPDAAATHLRGLLP